MEINELLKSIENDPELLEKVVGMMLKKQNSDAVTENKVNAMYLYCVEKITTTEEKHYHPIVVPGYKMLASDNILSLQREHKHMADTCARMTHNSVVMCSCTKQEYAKLEERLNYIVNRITEIVNKGVEVMSELQTYAPAMNTEYMRQMLLNEVFSKIETYGEALSEKMEAIDTTGVTYEAPEENDEEFEYEDEDEEYEDDEDEDYDDDEEDDGVFQDTLSDEEIDKLFS